MRSKLASSIAILLNYGAKWRVLYYIFYVLCLDLELSSIIDPHYTNILTRNTMKHSDNSLFISLNDNVFFGFIGITNPWKYIAGAIPVPATFFVLFLLTAFNMMIILGLFQYPSDFLIRNWLTLPIINTVVIFYEYFLLVMTSLIHESFTCVVVYSEDGNPVQNSKLFVALNENVECLSSSHFMIMLVSTYILLSGVFIQRVSSKMSNFRPSPVFPSKYGIGNSLHFTIIVVLYFLRSLTIYLSESDHFNPVYFLYLTLLIFAMDLIFQLFNSCWLDLKLDLLLGLRVICNMTLTFTAARYWSGYSMYTTPRSKEMDTQRYSLNRALWCLIGVAFMFKVYSILKIRIRSFPFSSMDSQNAKLKRVLRLLYNIKTYISSYMTDEDFPQEPTLAKHLLEFRSSNTWIFKQYPQILDLIDEILRKIANGESDSNKKCINNVKNAKNLLYLQENYKLGICFPNYSRLVDSTNITRESVLRETLDLKNHLIDAMMESYISSKTDPPQILKNKYIVFMAEFKGQLTRAALLCSSTDTAKQKYNSEFAKAKQTGLVATLNPLKSVMGVLQKISLLSTMGDNIDSQILIEYIKVIAIRAAQTGDIILAGVRSRVLFKFEQTQIEDLTSSIHFLNTLSVLKQKILQVVELKRDIALTAEKTGFKVHTLFNSANKYTTLVDEIASGFKLLNIITPDPSNSLQLLYCYYLIYVIYDLKHAISLVANLSHMLFLDYCDPINCKDNFVQWKRTPTMVMVSGEPRSFHKVTYASSNIHCTTGFRLKEIMNEDLKVLIPRPFSDWHPEYLKPELATSSVLENKNSWGILVKHTEGYFFRTNIVIRLNFGLELGLQYIGKIKQVVDSYTDGKGMLIIDESGLILELNKNASRIFKKNTYLDKYSYDLISMLNEFYKASLFKRKYPYLDIEDIMSSNKDVLEFKDYFSIVNGMRVAINDFDGIPYTINMSMSDVNIDRSGSAVIIMHFDKVSYLEDNVATSAASYNSAFKQLMNSQTLDIVPKARLGNAFDSMNMLQNVLSAADLFSAKAAFSEKPMSSSELPYLIIARVDEDLSPRFYSKLAHTPGLLKNKVIQGSSAENPTIAELKRASAMKKYTEMNELAPTTPGFGPRGSGNNSKPTGFQGYKPLSKDKVIAVNRVYEIFLKLINARRLAPFKIFHRMQRRPSTLRGISWAGQDADVENSKDKDKQKIVKLMTEGGSLDSGVSVYNQQRTILLVTGLLSDKKSVKRFRVGTYVVGSLVLACLLCIIGMGEAVIKRNIAKLNQTDLSLDMFKSIFDTMKYTMYFGYYMLIDRLVVSKVINDNYFSDIGQNSLRSVSLSKRAGYTDNQIKSLLNISLVKLKYSYPPTEGEFADYYTIPFWKIELKTVVIKNKFELEAIKYTLYRVIKTLNFAEKELMKMERASGGYTTNIYAIVSKYLSLNIYNSAYIHNYYLYKDAWTHSMTMLKEVDDSLKAHAIASSVVLGLTIGIAASFFLLLRSSMNAYLVKVFSFKRDLIVQEKDYWNHVIAKLRILYTDPYKVHMDVMKFFKDKVRIREVASSDAENFKRSAKYKNYRELNLKIKLHGTNYGYGLLRFLLRMLIMLAVLISFETYMFSLSSKVPHMMIEGLNLHLALLELWHHSFLTLSSFSLMFNTKTAGSLINQIQPEDQCSSSLFQLANAVIPKIESLILSSTLSTVASVQKINERLELCSLLQETYPLENFYCDSVKGNVLRMKFTLVMRNIVSAQERILKLWKEEPVKDEALASKYMQDFDVSNFFTIAQHRIPLIEVVNNLILLDLNRAIIEAKDPILDLNMDTLYPGVIIPVLILILLIIKKMVFNPVQRVFLDHFNILALISPSLLETNSWLVDNLKRSNGRLSLF